MATRNVLILLKLLSQSISFLIIVAATTENICIELCYMCMGSAPAYNVSCLVNVRTKVEKEIVRNNIDTWWPSLISFINETWFCVLFTECRGNIQVVILEGLNFCGGRSR